MSFSDFDSDLTDLSLDEDSNPSVEVGRTTREKLRDEKREFVISNALRPPRTTQYTAKFVYEQIIENAIILDPEYQRDIVWSETKMSHLIDSIMRNYYIPPVIFAVHSANDGTEMRICIDGKQRLTSIHRFMDGLVPYRDSVTGQKLWYKQIAGGSKRNLLPRKLAQLFESKQVVCMEYDRISDDQEREIFQRVQMGVALTPAERMQANTSEMAHLVRGLQSEIIGPNGFDGSIDWDHTRGRDFQCITAIAFLLHKYPVFCFPTTSQLEKWLGETELTLQFRQTLTDAIRTFLALMKNRNLSAAFRTPMRVSPVEFIMSGLLVGVHRDTLSFTQLSSAIEQLRADVRAKEKDIRMNTRTTKIMLKFISEKVQLLKLKSDGQGDSPASKSHLQPPTPKSHPQPQPHHKKAKRKRVESEDEGFEIETPQRKAATSASASNAYPAVAKHPSSLKSTVKSPKSTKKPTLVVQSNVSNPASRNSDRNSMSRPSSTILQSPTGYITPVTPSTGSLMAGFSKQSSPTTPVVISPQESVLLKDRLDPLRAAKAARVAKRDVGIINELCSHTSPTSRDATPILTPNFRRQPIAPKAISQPPVTHIPSGIPLTNTQVQALLARLPPSLVQETQKSRELELIVPSRSTSETRIVSHASHAPDQLPNTIADNNMHPSTTVDLRDTQMLPSNGPLHTPNQVMNLALLGSSEIHADRPHPSNRSPSLLHSAPASTMPANFAPSQGQSSIPEQRQGSEPVPTLDASSSPPLKSPSASVPKTPQMCMELCITTASTYVSAPPPPQPLEHPPPPLPVTSVLPRPPPSVPMLPSNPAPALSLPASQSLPPLDQTSMSCSDNTTQPNVPDSLHEAKPTSNGWQKDPPTEPVADRYNPISSHSRVLSHSPEEQKPDVQRTCILPRKPELHASSYGYRARNTDPYHDVWHSQSRYGQRGSYNRYFHNDTRGY